MGLRWRTGPRSSTSHSKISRSTRPDRAGPVQHRDRRRRRWSELANGRRRRLVDGASNDSREHLAPAYHRHVPCVVGQDSTAPSGQSGQQAGRRHERRLDDPASPVRDEVQTHDAMFGMLSRSVAADVSGRCHGQAGRRLRGSCQLREPAARPVPAPAHASAFSPPTRSPCRGLKTRRCG